MSEIDISELREFFELRNLDQISTRIFYLYYRTLAAFREQRTVLLDAVVVVVQAFLALTSFFSYLLSMNLYVAFIALFLVILAIYPFVRAHISGKRDLATLTDTLRLGVHLDQILKQASEIMWLNKYLGKKPGDSLVSDLAADNCTVLGDSISSVEDIVKRMRENEKLNEALEDMHIDRLMIERRIRLGKLMLARCNQILGK